MPASSGCTGSTAIAKGISQAAWLLLEAHLASGRQRFPRYLPIDSARDGKPCPSEKDPQRTPHDTGHHPLDARSRRPQAASRKAPAGQCDFKVAAERAGLLEMSSWPKNILPWFIPASS